jgi:hypothetical protein
MQSNKKIAFCFLIYDIINKEDIWNSFFSNVDKEKYNIYIHYKTQVELKYFEKYKLNNCIETKYGDISLVLAQNILLKRALEDSNTNYIFVSQSCIPVKSFDYIYDFLNPNFSYFNIAPDLQCFPIYNNLIKYFDKNVIKKASQWCILNQSHAKLMVDNNDNIKKWFSNIKIPDEIVYITLLYHLNLQNELILTPNLASGSTTSSQWPNQKGFKAFSKSVYYKKLPKTYFNICEEEMSYLKNEPCLFARKFEASTKFI